MNYRHHYHAGNSVDVVKHFILTLLIQAFHQKTTPYCVLDTHGGIGLYDLEADAAERTGEYREGIAKLWNAPALPAVFQPYLDLVRRCNPGGDALRFYPGSVLISAMLARPTDRLVACELHPQDHRTLRTTLAPYANAAVHHQNGYLGLKAFLPPKERRGLVLIDPPYEHTDEFSQLVSGLEQAYKRFAHGVYAIWYPIKDRPPVEEFYQYMRHTGVPKILTMEFLLHPATRADRLNGCGILFINPPWQLDVQLKESLPVLLEVFGKNAGSKVEVKWLE